MSEDSKRPRFSMEVPQLLVMHERILLCFQGNDSRARWLNILGDILSQSYKASGNEDDLNRAICAYRDAVRDGPGPVIYLANFGIAFRHRFERFGSLLDINRSVIISKLLLSALHFEQYNDLNDLNKCVLRFEAAVTLTPDGHPDKPSWLNNLGNSLLRRFERLGGLNDLDQSVLRLEAAVPLTPDGHPNKPSLLSNLATSLLCRFERLGDLDDLSQSVLRLEAALTLTPDGDMNKPGYLSNLGSSLSRHFERLGDLDDLNQSVLRFEAAVTLTPDGHPNNPTLLSNLGNSLLAHFERLGGLDDLNQSVLRLEAAVNLSPDGHPDKPSWLNNLGNSLLSRFKRLGGLDDLNQSVLRLEAAVTLTPNGHPDKPSWLNTLGSSLLGRFEQLGGLDDLNQSVLRFEAVVTLTPNGHPDKPSQLNGHPDRPSRLSNVGNSLLRRFERLGGLDDINQSVLRFEAAITLTPDGHLDKPSRLHNLGHSLLGCFERLGGLDDLNQSVLRLEAAVTLTPDGHPDKASLLNTLASSLLSRFERLGGLHDLNQSSILRLEAAVTLTPDSHLDKPSILNNLGNSLLRRFERLDGLDDLNLSLLRFEAAVGLTPDGHPNKPSRLTNLGSSLYRCFQRLHDPQDSQKMLLHYTSAACSETGPASIRFHAATQWAKHAHIHEPSLILCAYTTAIELLPELAWLELSITDRHHHLSQAGQVVRDAASAAIIVHDYKKAVDWLDQGRSVIWGQLLNLRTPVDELRKSHPSLADRLVSLSTALETAGTRSNVVANAINPQSLESIAEQSHAFALERNDVLQQIRELPGLERFLLSKPFSELLCTAKMEPVAILNTSVYGCDALILMPDLGDEEGNMAPDDIFSYILSVLWFKIVHPIINALGITRPVKQDLGRIWWCPTGPLAFLPIHAAGVYGEDQTFGSKSSDYLISSYTPSLTALIKGFRPLSESQAELQLLAEEIGCIQRCVEGKKVHLEWLDGEMATIDEVQKGMKNSRWVHFACHGVQSDSPTESALLLAGSSRLTLSNIIQLNLPNADLAFLMQGILLAFLSACQTTTGSQELQDESVHLTAGMLLAGYRGVIGTMWSIDDNDAPQVAGDVYAYLLEISPPDPTRAAEALHLAIQKLREQPGPKTSFLQWVPFIHFGV
ncbi:TPR-like protein [Mycena rebaudengoi]|nr:TPR-like protein [Mycena rebaudengoi]